MCGASASFAYGSGGSSMAIASSLAGFRAGRKVYQPGSARMAGFPASKETRHGNPGPHPRHRRTQPDRALHEGHAAVPDVRLLEPRLAGAGAGRGDVPQHQRARGSRDPREPAALLELADVPAALHQRRADRRLRHPAGAAREGRAREHGVRGAEGLTARAAYTPAVHAHRADALAGRVVLVTGACGGFGTAAAHAAARAGATVVLLGRRVRALEKLYDALEAAGAPKPAIYPLNLEGATPADY